MKKWNRMLAAVLSASMIFSMAPAGVWAAETAAVQESQEESGEFDAAMAAAQNSEESLAGGSDAASAEVTEEAESGAAVAADEATDDADVADQADAVDEAAGADADTADAEGADAADEAGADADADEEADAAEAADEKDAVGAEEADAGISEQDGAKAESESEDSSEAESSSVEEAAETGETESVSKEAAAAGESGQEAEKPVDDNELSYMTLDSETLISHMDMRDNDELFEEYANRMFYGVRSSGMKLRSSSMAGSKLSGLELAIYNKTKPEIKKIADGESNNANIQIPLSELGFQSQYTARELGIEYIRKNGEMHPGLVEAVSALFAIDVYQLQAAIFADCPYELYWNDGSLEYAPSSFAYNDNYVIFSPDKCISMKFGVDPDYSGVGEYSVDTNKTRAVKTASDRAHQIVNEAVKMSDYYKLNYYREQICDLVEYNHDAAGNDDYPNHGPWNLIFVFDDNPTTNVVCEGYAEAFQYLAELTSFSSDLVRVYSVSGTMTGGTGAGGHKWNIVRMENGLNYMADITNSDAGSIGSDGTLFLAGMKGSVDEYYYKVYPGEPEQTIKYTYYDEMHDIYSEEELTLSLTDYNNTTSPTFADEKAIPKGLSLFLTDKIGMRVYVKTFVNLADTDYMEFSYAGKTVEVPVSDAKDVVILDSDGKSIHVLAFEIELWTKQMTEEVSFRLNIGGDDGMVKTYSVRSYADQILAGNYSEKQKSMVRAMLNYGGYAQTYLNYNTDRLANSSIYDEDPVQQEAPDLSRYSYTFNEAADTKGFNIKEVTLCLGTDVSLVYYYELTEGKTVDDFDFKLVDSDKKLEFDHDDNKGMDYVMIRHIMPGELDTMYTLTVTPENETTPVTTFTYSPFSYCKAKIEKTNGSEKIKNLCKSLYYYWKAANEMLSYNDQATITIGDQSYALQLEDNESARTFADKLPLELNSYEDFYGKAVYGYLTVDIQNHSSEVESFAIKTGDLILSESDTVFLAYSDFTISAGTYIKIGEIKDVTGLQDSLASNLPIEFNAQ